MHKMIKKKDSLELADLVLRHDPDASTEQIAEVMSEWGDLFDDKKFASNKSVNIESDAPKGKPKSRT